MQDVRYSASGDHFVSVGSDGKMFLYDGKDGSTVAEINASQGSVVSPSRLPNRFVCSSTLVKLAVSWSGDSKRLSTSSADGTVKICQSRTRLTLVTMTEAQFFFEISGNAETKQAIQTYTIGTDVASQQNGNVWANENSIVSLGLDGTLNVIDPRVDGKWNQIHVRALIESNSGVLL